MTEQSIGIGAVASILGPLLGLIGALIVMLYKGLKGDLTRIDEEKQDRALCNERHKGGK